MLLVRDLIRVLRFPLQEVSDWISLARASQLDYGAVAEVSLYLAGGFLRGLPLLYSPECVEGKFCELRRDGVLGNSALSWCSDVLCALAHIHSPYTSVC